jgi:putative phosphoesterase
MSPDAAGAIVRVPGRVLRVAVLSDTHGHLDERIQDLATTCDLAIHGGDIGNAAVLARLQPRLGCVVAVFGNNDTSRQWPETDHDLLRALPEWVAIELQGGRLVVIHGHQGAARHRHARLRARFPDARMVVYGHSHRLVLDMDSMPWVINPGAAGRTRTYGGPSCLVLTASETDWHIDVHRFAFVAASRRSNRDPTERQRSEGPEKSTLTG